mmetsp:Transcript_16549/g.41848  ORF Transcript_16549/g.41848 Transcript_16549/m.41848 type:complete len:426 (+) Transcript_16549:147-1424(+)|eukprot:CAMPEP_0173464040 /NCGR_PEP_ID=MMETSP1357-20121228/69259_1 /TAXON_ID=77926 /ORGANISM="Hemiselmis rufescens, Strain PCC563" /LENGTH=425 /DNA_ID=CAMNT_0014431909 /DNA_START=38 /DNA_END=1315 /DNA_ORIENTATION=+
MSVWDSSSFSIDRGFTSGVTANPPAAVAAAAGGLARRGPLSRARPVRIVRGECDAARFRREIQAAREPVVLRGLLIGQCLGLWNADYLMDKGGDKDVSVHVSAEARMDFVSKNFAYRTLPFPELVRRAAYGCQCSYPEGEQTAANQGGEGVPAPHVQLHSKHGESLTEKGTGMGGSEGRDTANSSPGSTVKGPEGKAGGVAAGQDPNAPFFISQSEKYYLRALGTDPRKDIADLKTDFPQLADDIQLPELFDPADYFSSVLRVGSPGLHLWTHYDTMDNALVQIVGTKRVVLFPPSDADSLYLKGDKSMVLDIDNPDLSQFPLFDDVHPFECALLPGDLLFIPALWFHNVVAHDFSVAVNVFWRQLPKNMYETNDTYGNKDPVPATRAMMSLASALKALSSLPADHQDFFARRMVNTIKTKAFLS